MTENTRKGILEKAKANRTRLRNGLAERSKPKPVGFHTQGSYAMRSMIWYADGDYDIDDGVYFKEPELVGEQGGKFSAIDVRNMVAESLKDKRFAKQPEVRTNCVRVYYNEGYHVDIPAYRRIEKVNQFTGLTTYEYQLAGPDWKNSDPRAVTLWFQAQNQSKSSDASANHNDGQFIRIVRLLKAFARSRPSWKASIASGFTVTKLAADHFSEHKSRDDSALRTVMQQISTRLTWKLWVEHPVLNENIVEANEPKVTFLRQRLDENLEHLKDLDASDCDHKRAMAAWDKVFNTDWFSKRPDPEGEKEGGDEGKTEPIVKKGGGRYA